MEECMIEEAPLSKKQPIPLMTAACLMVSGLALAASAYGLSLVVEDQERMAAWQEHLVRIEARLAGLEQQKPQNTTSPAAQPIFGPDEWNMLLERMEMLEAHAKAASAEPGLPVAEAHDVGQLQYSLTKLGYDIGGIDCVVGPRTIKAWLSFAERLEGDEDKLTRLHELALLSGSDVARPTCAEDKAKAPTETKPKDSSKPNSWRIRAAMPGRAWLDRQGQDGLTEVRPGDQLDGLGQVKAIEHDGRGGWVLTAQHGALSF